MAIAHTCLLLLAPWVLLVSGIKSSRGHAKGEQVQAYGDRVPKIGASIAVHPPKFPMLARFLEQRAACPAAREAMSVFAVFSSQKDLDTFKLGLEELAPNVPGEGTAAEFGGWTAVVGEVPEGIKSLGDQKIAAWKKFYGLAAMMDLGARSPDYGLPMDAELVLYDQQDCGSNSTWHGFLGRLADAEASKSWPVAQVGDSRSYNFGSDSRPHTVTGRTYDEFLIRENAAFITKGKLSLCDSEACNIVKQQIKFSQFSWWTDVPWMNLEVAKRMFSAMGKSKPQASEEGQKWKRISAGISWPCFEHMAYQQWCVLHEGFNFTDVTKQTGFALWGSYMEDPPAGAQLGDLHPLWVSAEALVRSERGEIQHLSEEQRPVMVFHVDHCPSIRGCEDRFGSNKLVERWRHHM
eukprot:gb/GFBE01013910.1/.p1 GENE.gb/GFBE01013910.1/~~gb/GFBE01013910.1/.p1  ORF type:complete len:407 (+),score=83.29 gb/GFBE01013910.1/:1-1221(+)